MGQLSLQPQLEAFRESFIRRLPPAERACMDRVGPASGNGPVLHAGDPAPRFILPDQHGAAVSLVDRLAMGPVMLLFVRGGWCPFCTLTLRAYQAWLPAIHDAGGEIFAITPQPAGPCCQMAERDLLAFQTLSDHGNRTAAAYGIASAIDPALRPMYLRLGHDLPEINATGDWGVPLPATFVINQAGLVTLAHVGTANHLRLEPAQAVAALQAA